MSRLSELQELIEIYEKEIEPYKFMYKLQFGIEITLEIKKEEVCHLIFGTLTNKNIPNSSFYKGKKGYNKIKSGEIIEVPYQLRKTFKSKSKAFKVLGKLLTRPKAIMFNKKIVKKGNIGTTDIDANFLFFRDIDGVAAHLFLTYIKNEREQRYVAKSCLHNIDNTYKKDQIELKIVEIDKVLKS